MSGFGERLRQARESRNITLDEIADETRIRRAYLEALEAGDLPSLPGGAFNRGYVRAYAEFVGEEPDALVAAYLEEEAEQSHNGSLDSPAALGDLSRAIEDRLTLGGTPGRRPGRVIAAAAVLVGAAALLAVGWWWWPGGDRSQVAAPPVASQEVPARPPEPVPEPPAQPARAEPPVADPVPRAVTVPETITNAPPAVVDAAPLETPSPRTPPPAASSGGMTVPDFGVGTGVVDRRLVGRGESFPAGTQVWFWTRVVGGAAGRNIEHVWLHEGRVMGRNLLAVGASHWRTQSRKTVYEGLEGAWAVEARDDDGRVLARQEFTVRPAGS